MRRRTICILMTGFVVISALVASPFIIHASRQRRFIATQDFVQQHGGSLDFDLVDGNYLINLQGDAATDETIHKLVPRLKELPTGFTLIGPGEGRSFWISLSGKAISDAGLTKLCELEVEWLSLNGVSVTDASASLLSRQSKIRGIVLDNIHLSDSAIAQLRVKMPDVTLLVDGVDK